MLPTPPYDAYSEALYSHGSIPTIHPLRYGVPSASRIDMPRYDDYGYSRQLSQPDSTFPTTRAVYHPKAQPHLSANKLAQGQGSSNTYNVAGPPVLPPIQVPARSLDDFQQTTRPDRAPTGAQSQSKEEKVGGVAAHLDYRMEEMVDFVSEMAQGMYGIYASKLCLADIDMTRSVMNSNISVHPDFRRYVNQVLTSTRLPSSTILLGLHYLTVRMTMLSARGKYTYGGGDVYNMLTTALLLGSKFLDDNTFQNRSWSDVSNIPVKKLNMLESEWLQEIKWDMHFDPSDSKGFALWRRRWHTFHAATPRSNIDSLSETLKRTSIDNSFQRQQNTFQPLSSNTRYVPNYSESSAAGHYFDRSTQWQAPRYDQWASVRSGSEYSPPSAPETGPNTPDYAMTNGFAYGGLPPPMHPSLKMPPPLHILPSNAPAHGYSTPQYNQYVGHGSSCICTYCMPHYDRYSTNYAYDQAVVG